MDGPKAICGGVGGVVQEEALFTVMNPAKRAAKAVLRPIVSNPIQAALVTWMARSGVGTDACLKRGSLPLPVHFYSPVPDLDDLKRRDVWSRRSELPGVDFRPEAQVAYLLELGERYGRECAWPPQPTKDPSEFYTENGAFSFGCAAAAHTVIRDRKPKRVIEIGSGMSSTVLSAALGLNEAEGAQPAEYTIVDPFPSPRLPTLSGTRPKVIAERVEVVGVSLFEQRIGQSAQRMASSRRRLPMPVVSAVNSGISKLTLTWL